MKKILTLFLTITACASSLSAQEISTQDTCYCTPPGCGTFYISGFGGINLIPHVKFHSLSDRYVTKNDFRTGYYVGTAVGYKLDNSPLRYEVEFSYRSNPIKGHIKKSNSESSGHFHFPEDEGAAFAARKEGSDRFRFHRNLSVFAILFNSYLDLNFCNWWWNLKPYLGAGIGYGRNNQSNIHFKDRESHSHRGRNHHSQAFAWQFIVGLGYPVADCTDIAVEYRYFGSGLQKVYNHSVGTALRYSF